MSEATVSAAGRMSLTSRLWLFGAIAAAIVAAHANVIRDLISLSTSDSAASHVAIIPVLSAVLVFNRRGEIFAEISSCVSGGLAIIAAGVVLTAATPWLSSLTGVGLAPSLAAGGMIVQLIGAFLLVFGWSAFVSARFALGFLLLAMPIPPVVLDGLTQMLKRGSALAVSALFTLTGTPFHREGFIYALPRLSIEIADACSGIRSSIALGLSALLMGHLTLTSAWSRVVLLLAVLPITVLKNGLRIVSLSLLTIYVDPSFLAGRLHNDGGIAFFLLALALLMPVLALLRRWNAAVHAPGRLPLSSVGSWSRKPDPPGHPH